MGRRRWCAEGPASALKNLWAGVVAAVGVLSGLTDDTFVFRGLGILTSSQEGVQVMLPGGHSTHVTPRCLAAAPMTSPSVLQTQSERPVLHPQVPAQTLTAVLLCTVTHMPTVRTLKMLSEQSVNF